MTMTPINVKQILGRLRRFLSYLNEGPQRDWDRVTAERPF